MINPINLWPHQVRAVKFLSSKKKGMLIMGCRTGKSLVALTAAKEARQPTVIVCPPAIVEVWESELKKCKLKNARIIKKTEKQKIFLLSQNRWVKDITLIIDEAHEGLIWKQARELITLAKKVSHCYLLTATPLLNRTSDLYWPLKISLNASFSKKDFLLKFCGGKENSWAGYIEETGPTNVKELWEMLLKAGYFYRNPLEKKWLWVINSNIGKAPFTSNKVSFEKYSARQSLLAHAKTENWAMRSRMETLLYDLRAWQKKVLLMYFHNHLRDAFLDIFPKDKYPCISGEVSFAKREKIIQNFNKSREGLLWVNIKSGGRGLNMPADKVIFLERTWSPSADYQAYMRGFGFTRNTPLEVEFWNFEDESKMLKNESKQKELYEVLKPFIKQEEK